jgi:hypothetical protein
MGKGRSGFPEGMTERKATARADAGDFGAKGEENGG